MTGVAIVSRDAQGAVVSWSKDEADLIRQTLCPGATDGELALFAHVAKSKGLSPFSNQIIMQIRHTKHGRRPVFLTTIDGARAKAARTGQYAGNEEPEYQEGPMGRPAMARVTVWRLVGGTRHPFTASARWAEYCPQQGQDAMWQKMPYVMLGKCAEMQALRKAFPEELGDLKIREEMEQSADEVTTETTQAQRAATVTQTVKARAQVVEAQVVDELGQRRQRALKAFEDLGKTEADVLAKLGVSSVQEVTVEHLSGLLAAWYEELSQPGAGA